ncbi:uncharacterized protein LOC135392465 [Ornithodoros turicata]|uniref:uncharacterized protein LOC135392465 n=1 Tax=Ornithodoros turicata TaxID=34597 RepID=UPI003138CE29
MPVVMLGICSAFQENLSCTAAELVYGKILRLPGRRPSKVFLHPDLNKSTHVFLRHDAMRKPLSPHYNGPYRVLSRNRKTFAIDIAGQRIVVSVDRVKPAYLLKPASPFPHSPLSRILPKPRRKVTWATPLRVHNSRSPPL